MAKKNAPDKKQTTAIDPKNPLNIDFDKPKDLTAEEGVDAILIRGVLRTDLMIYFNLMKQEPNARRKSDLYHIADGIFLGYCRNNRRLAYALQEEWVDMGKRMVEEVYGITLK